MTIRGIVSVAARPMWRQVWPPSADLYTPAPAFELRKMFASPVPTQTMSGFDGAMVTSPIEVVTPWSKTGAHVTPSLSVFHSPPVAVAAKMVYDLPRGVTTATSVTRPLMFVGPRNCHVMP
jgi:hypothetical protein